VSTTSSKVGTLSPFCNDKTAIAIEIPYSTPHSVLVHFVAVTKYHRLGN
jgi:hypothetical protein